MPREDPQGLEPIVKLKISCKIKNAAHVLTSVFIRYHLKNGSRLKKKTNISYPLDKLRTA
jgi:hypothetical protein